MNSIIIEQIKNLYLVRSPIIFGEKMGEQDNKDKLDIFTGYDKLNRLFENLVPKYFEQTRILQDKLVPQNFKALKEMNAKYISMFPSSSIFDAYKKFEVFTPQMDANLKQLQEIDKMARAVHSFDNLKARIPHLKILGLLEAKSINDTKWLEYDLDDSEEEIELEKKTEILSSIPSLIKDIYHNQNLLNTIDPRKFEEVIAELLYKQGFDVELTKQTRDGGYDILALSKIGGIPFKMLVECKRYNNTVGVDIIRSFCDVIKTEQANKGVIFTTSYFSLDAKVRKEKEGALLDLKDRPDIINWVNDYCRNT